MASRGNTPLPSGQDGLGTQAGSQTISMNEGAAAGARNAEEEKARRLHEVQQLLKTRIAGRGICREGVERIAQQSGLTHAWIDDNNLSIAGNCVDLEIVFDESQRDLVTDVVLKISTSGVEEHKQEASAVLKQDLAKSDNDTLDLPWNNLNRFSTNLGRLAHLDHLSTGINCFEAVEGLYHCFRKIWDEEKKQSPADHSLSRTCSGIVGRPNMHKRRKLGLCLDYWEENKKLREQKADSPESDAMDIDQHDSIADDGEESSATWMAKIGCETGYPPIRVTKEWLGEDVFLNDGIEVDTDSDVDQYRTARAAWLDPSPTLVASSDIKDDSEMMAIDGPGAGVSLPKPPNIRFTFDLEPVVLVPVNAVSVMMAQGLTITFEPGKALTYRQALDNLERVQNIVQGESRNDVGDYKAHESQNRWKRSLTVHERGGKSKSVLHSYILHGSTAFWYYPLQSLCFDHPRQLAEIMPVLRQYALLWSILRKLVPRPEKVATSDDIAEDGQISPMKVQTKKKSNINAQRTKLDALLKDPTPVGTGSATNFTEKEKSAISIDVSLTLIATTSSRPKLDLVFPLPLSGGRGARKDQAHFGTVGIEIGANGEVLVNSTTGLTLIESDDMMIKMARVLSISEDIGVLVQWLLDRF